MANFPMGWKELQLSEVLDYDQPNEYLVKSEILEEETSIPVLTANKSFIKGYTNETKGVYRNVPVIIFDDFTADTKFVNFPFKVKSSAMKILKLKDKRANMKFIFYQMQLIDVNTTTHKRYYISHYQNLPFIFPTDENGEINLEEQQQIVDEIEKQFTRLDASIKDLRSVKERLGSYRKSILKAVFNFDCDFDVKSIGDFERKGGGTPSTKVKEYWGGNINWITSANIDERNNIHYEKKITELGLKNSATNLVPKGSVIIVTRVGLGKVAVTEEATAFSQDSQGIICTNINPYFLMWQVKSASNQIISKGQGTTISGITVHKLNEITVKVPSPQKQEEVVQEIEAQFSVIDKLEQTIDSALQQTEQLRKSILKNAFEGKLVREVMA